MDGMRIVKDGKVLINGDAWEVMSLVRMHFHIRRNGIYKRFSIKTGKVVGEAVYVKYYTRGGEIIGTV